MEIQCRAEVMELHKFFVEWFTGRSPADDDSFARFARVLAPGFVIVSPRGIAHGRETILTDIQPTHGSMPDFEVWIENLSCSIERSDVCLMTYEEWQRSAGETTCRISSALFIEEPNTPNGVAWLHVHETWRPPSD